MRAKSLDIPEVNGINCSICKFYRHEGASTIDGDGVCVRYPPVSLQGGGVGFPKTLPVAWCGEHVSIQKTFL